MEHVPHHHHQKRGSGTSVTRSNNEMLSPILINPRRISSAELRPLSSQETVGVEPRSPALASRALPDSQEETSAGRGCAEQDVPGLQKPWASSPTLLSHSRSRVGREGKSSSPAPGGAPIAAEVTARLPTGPVQPPPSDGLHGQLSPRGPEQRCLAQNQQAASEGLS